MKQYEFREKDVLVITFDDEKTNLKIIIDELKKGKFSVTGDPVYTK